MNHKPRNIGSRYLADSYSCLVTMINTEPTNSAVSSQKHHLRSQQFSLTPTLNGRKKLEKYTNDLPTHPGKSGCQI